MISKARHHVSLRPLLSLAALGAMALYAVLGAQGSGAPKYKFDPDWPKPLPNKWKIGGVTGLAVDKDDNVWVLNRPDDLRDIELEAELNPPTADCCVRPPSMIHIDKNGNVIGSFDAPQGHGMDVDSKGSSTSDRTRSASTTRRPASWSGGASRARAGTRIGRRHGGQRSRCGRRHVCRAAAAPVRSARFPQQPGSRPWAGRPGALAPPPRAAFRAKYPPTTPMIVGGIEEIRLDEAANEMYVADNYLGGRVMVFDLDTFAFKRGWGAYGHKLSEITTDDADRAYTPGGPMPKEFRGHLTLNFSNDGLVYAADRNANRIHVTKKHGKFVKEFILAPTTGVGGSTGGVGFSPDKAQKFLYISDLTNNHIWFLNREDGKVVGQMGSMGENGGQFFGLHMIAVDSKGNIYTGEVFTGERVQRSCR